MTSGDMYDIVLLALCTWREAQNQTRAAQIGQAWSVRNRVDRPGFWDWGDSYSTVILRPWQYSSFNHDDPNSRKIPLGTDPSWQQCLAIAQDVYQGISEDPTQGSTHYFDRSRDSNPPAWAEKMDHVIDLGQLRFYRPRPAAISA